ncbi:DUF4040 domain-containing protein [Lusitaniella coriacea LEGE 07157]|uniref:DUF4040 domain-containing protein n=1 Tax=Lusitaniella coriacea LEGE 07157 TaxID=945747 RepID=A0A8J7DXM6_9CYAN|nr:DUF4040 domain-containing protein [Lusitaniella coriacea]MBE9117072.1 DUF4040 domain-containing protein [Lusitaniella coriacea LEGE 07157]
MIDSYIYVIVALLPLVALMLVFQVNPYQALVIRAILGAVAALVYAVLGAADVALTEALVGTMLAITLYIVAVRSSLVMRLGIIEELGEERESYFAEIIANLKKVIDKHYMRLELVEYPNSQALEQALMAKEVHATCAKQEELEPDSNRIYHAAIRVRRLFEIMQTELSVPEVSLTYITVPNEEEKH